MFNLVFKKAEPQDPTRNKIIEAAGEIFAAEGFQAATVREICARAGVNIASINYYFGDKTGLYVELLRQSTCAVRMDMIKAAARPDSAPEDTLRDIIHGMCRAMLARNRPSYASRLMAHEMVRPTPALDKVIEEVISPTYQRMRDALGKMLRLPPDHATTRMCAHSIIGQIIHYVGSRPVIAKVWPDLQMTPEQIEMLADHITSFSLCSVKEIARTSQGRPHTKKPMQERIIALKKAK